MKAIAKRSITGILTVGREYDVERVDEAGNIVVTDDSGFSVGFRTSLELIKEKPEKQQTAMQKLIEWLETEFIERHAFEAAPIQEKAVSLLREDKTNLKSAYYEGYVNGCSGPRNQDSEAWYNETYEK